MKGSSLIPSGSMLNRIIQVSQRRSKKKLLANSAAYVAAVEVRVKASELHELVSQALAAEKEIMYALENLNNKLDNAEICA